MSLSTSNEPSLEEILTSIRRIIAEDGPATAAASMAAPGGWSAPPEADEDVLVLTERVPMNGQTFLHPEAAAPAPAQVEAAEIEASQPAVEVIEVAQIDVEPTPALVEDEVIQPKAFPEVEPVVAMDTEAKTAAAFERLDAAAHAATPAAPSILMPPPGRTLEDVIREMMQPLLKEWLDENLPAIVQARVDEEIERIARRRVR
jgi:cell pole-organizing protein PopZ